MTNNSTVHGDSILPPQMHGGVVKVAGYLGSGKTSFAIYAERPSLTLFMDYEHKGRGFHSQLGFGQYVDMVEGCTSPGMVFDKTMETITGIEQDRYTHAIIDNGSPLELALTAGARRDLGRYCEEYGINYKNALASRYGGVKPIVNFFISDKICNSLFGKGIKMISIIHHISPRWGSGGPIPNKKRVKGYNRWLELAILSVVILKKGDFPPVPSAMIEKEQLSQMTFDKESGEYKQVRCLPFRLPRCTYSAIKEYFINPADLNNPAPGEKLVESEFKVFSDQLDEQQIALMRMSMEIEQRKEREASSAILELENGKAAQVREMKGKPLPFIAKTTGLSIPQVAKILGSI